jgi:hypothetical protein
LLSAALILLITLLPQLATASSVVPTSYPVLLFSRNQAPEPGVFAVHGEGFSPGGSVYLSVTSTNLPELSESFWTVATSAVYGPNGSQDPANGYIAAGEIDEWIAVTGETVYGPNGSQDPANGYRESGAAFCNGNIEVQAFDSESRTWSNQVRVILSC